MALLALGIGIDNALQLLLPAIDLSIGSLIGVVAINLAFYRLFPLLKTLPFASDDLSEAYEMN